jgi:diaminohydroxyphosphoribosylaminopyrimidine deaminase/5-amino-6-(5-phosphoribosylamino)uracil reductase
MHFEFTATDHAHMARALRLAERGLYTTQPNPRVGCVIAHGETIVGEGWHERAGEPHAEVIALRAAGERARGATAYVTLEPCAHFGRTPPCADALVAAGVGRVIAAAEDPNPRVNGGGFEKLRNAGVGCATGLLREPARELNRGFFSRMECERPWVRVKLAMSLDGRTALADGSSKWITGDAARADVQRWRARSSAILTGSGTVLADNPRLTVRAAPASDIDANTVDPLSPDEVGGEGWGEGAARQSHQRNCSAERIPLIQPSPASELGGVGLKASRSSWSSCFTPLRVVLDGELKTPRSASLLDGSTPTLFVHAPTVKPIDDRFARVELTASPSDPSGRSDLVQLLRLLAERGVNELQVEAGPTLCGALFEAGLVDELLLYVAPIVLGATARPLLARSPLASIAAAHRLRLIDERRIGADQRLLYRCGHA